jgi:hypothetical protein
MNKIIFCTLLSIALLSCNQAPKTDDSSSKGAETKALYEKNLSALKASLQAFQDEQLDGWASYIDDKAVYNSGAYGASPGTKEDWRKTLTFYVTDFDSIKLLHPIFLPGIDSVTHEPDGSVRYYGQWSSVHKSGVKTAVNYYATAEFNNDNKVISYSDYYDVGGLINAVSAKKSK